MYSPILGIEGLRQVGDARKTRCTSDRRLGLRHEVGQLLAVVPEHRVGNLVDVERSAVGAFEHTDLVGPALLAFLSAARFISNASN